MEHETPIGKMLSFDSLAEAEKITGKSYKVDEGTSAIGFLLHVTNIEKKRKALEANRDSHYGILFDDMIDLMQSLGFEIVLTDVFKGDPHRAGKSNFEQFIVMWNPEGILAKFESYNSTHLNSANMYYSLKIDRDKHVAQEREFWGVISSGRMLPNQIWLGSHDIREGVKYHLDSLRQFGDFLSVWPEQPFLWLLTYMDTKDPDYDHEKITAERISRLPLEVQEAIKGLD